MQELDTRTMIFVCRKYRFAYVPVGKVMNTSIKKWILAMDRPDIQGIETHRAAIDHLEWFWSTDEAKLSRLIDDPSMRVISFVRAPFGRLVSCYINKFVAMLNRRSLGYLRKRWYKAHIDLLAEIIRVHRPIGCRYTGITFREFIQFVAVDDHARMDLHWLPQVDTLRPDRVSFDFIGKQENADADLQRLYDLLGVTAQDRCIERQNRTSQDELCALGSCVDIRSRRLYRSRSYQGLSARNFRDVQLEALVRSVYSSDYSAFGYASELDPLPVMETA